jgi:hypothetical protein
MRTSNVVHQLRRPVPADVRTNGTASHRLTIARSVTCIMVLHNRHTNQLRPPLVALALPAVR